MSENSYIQEIMLRYLNGEATEGEAAELEQWIAENKSNKEEYDLVKTLWTETTEAALLPVDTDKAWKSVNAQTIDRQAKIVKIFPWKKTIAIAASIIIVAGTFYFSLRPSKTIWNETIAQSDNKKIQLPDGTVITLRKGSRLSLPEDYDKGRRQAKLEGEAYFDVTHDEQNPFSVTTAKSYIEDIGTAFLVQSMDSIEQVTVLEGEISFTNQQQNKTPLHLLAGESAILRVELPQRKNIDTTNLLSWKSNILIFNNTPLSLVAEDLEHYFQIDVEVAGNIKENKVTATFKDEPLEQVLRELRLFTGFNFKLERNKVIITK